MAETKRKWLWIFLLCATGVVLGGMLRRALFPPEPLEPIYLPPETVQVEVIPAEILAENALLHAENQDLVLKNGTLRDENGRLVKLNQSLSIVTDEVQEPPEITEILSDCLTDETLPPIRRYYRAGADLFQFEGLNPSGEIYQLGWRGSIYCEMRVSDSPEWRTLVRKPISLSQVVAQTSQAPEPVQRPPRLYFGLQYAFLSDQNFSSFETDPYSLVTERISVSSFRAYGGRIWFPKKRHQIRTGVFADSSSAGFDLSVSF